MIIQIMITQHVFKIVIKYGVCPVLDNCGICDDNPDNDNSTCVQDSNHWFSVLPTTDLCGVCDDDASNDNTTFIKIVIKYGMVLQV